MSRPRNQRFVTRPLSELCRQLLQYAPSGKRAEQVRRAEALHDELDDDAVYPVAYLLYRVTRYRPEHEDDELIPGDAAAADLRLLIDRLSHSSPQVVETDDEPIESLDDLVLRLGVTMRTLDRWRDRGLRWRWWSPGVGRRPTVGVTQSAWRRFESTHPELVSRALAYSRMPETQVDTVLSRARTLARGDATPASVAKRLAREFGRSDEAMRRLLLKHDAEHPVEPMFPTRRGPLSPRQRRFAERASRRGVPLRLIAERLGRRPATIHHVIQQRRLARLKGHRLPGVEPPARVAADVEAALAGRVRPSTMPTSHPRRDAARVSTQGLPAAIAAVVEQPMPAWETQHDLIARMHLLRFAVDRYRRGESRPVPRARDLDLAEARLAEADAIERRLLAVNLASALSVVRRHLQSVGVSGVGNLAEFLGVALDVLDDAIVTFDPYAKRTLDSVLRNRLLRRFASMDLTAGRARARPDPDAWTRSLLEKRGIACGWPAPESPLS